MHIPVGSVGLNISWNVTPRSFRYDTCLMLTIGSRGSKVNWGNCKHKEWRKETQHNCFSLFHVLFIILHLWHVQLIIHAIILFELYDKSSFLLLQQLQSNFLHLPPVTYMHFPVLPTSSYQFPVFASGDTIFPCLLLVSNFPCSPPQTEFPAHAAQLLFALFD